MLLLERGCAARPSQQQQLRELAKKADPSAYLEGDHPVLLHGSHLLSVVTPGKYNDSEPKTATNAAARSPTHVSRLRRTSAASRRTRRLRPWSGVNRPLRAIVRGHRHAAARRRHHRSIGRPAMERARRKRKEGKKRKKAFRPPAQNRSVDRRVPSRSNGQKGKEGQREEPGELGLE